MKKSAVFLFFYCIFCTHIYAQTPQLLKDIANGPSNFELSSSGIANNKLFFRGDAGSGSSPYVTDGTAAGTINLTPARGGEGFILYNGKVFFQGSDGNGAELWVTDGTAGGTSMFYNGYETGNFNPGMIGIFNNRLMFRANDSINGAELWSTDGTMAGTSMVKNINPNIGLQDGVSDLGYAILGSKMIFAANDGTTGQELWVTDGSGIGTTLIKDINTNNTALVNGSHPREFTVFNNKVFFAADDIANGRELWVTDGTGAGTMLFKDIELGSTGSAPADLTLHNNKLYFTAGDIFAYGKRNLYSTDGTPQGTLLIDDSVGNIYVFNNEIYYGKAIGSGTNPTHLVYGLFKTDGTVAGCTMLSALPSNNSPAMPFRYAVSGNKLFFIRNHSALSSIQPNSELWVTEGTAESTHIVMSATNPDSSFLCKYLPFIVSYNDEVYVLGREDSTIGDEIYKFNGITTSLERVNYSLNTKLFPNPAHNTVQLAVTETKAIQQLQICNSKGETVYEDAAINASEANINVQSLASGVYFIHIKLADGNILVEKFVKE